MKTSHRPGLRCAALATFATGIVAFVLGVAPAPALQALIVVPYVLFLPGYMLVRLVCHGMGSFGYPAAVAVSASLYALTGIVLVNSGVWAPHLAVAVPMAITAIACGLSVGPRPIAAERSARGSSNG